MPFGGTSIGSSGWWPFVVAMTRTGSSASPSKQRRIRSQPGSWAVLLATRTSGPSPPGSSMSGWGSSNSSGPVTTASAGQARGYSSCGKVPTIDEPVADAAVEAVLAAAGRSAPVSR